MKEIRTEIDIGASPARVWQVLTDFATYHEWNPFIRKIEGQPLEGTKLRIHITTPAGVKREYSPKVTRVVAEQELRWLGKMPGLLSGEHIFTIEPAGENAHLVHREVFVGLLASFFGASLDNDVKKGFEEMNAAMKKRAEG
ncbi:MAG TPA: SRPBCC domain-containing protein [Nitrososphaera sp.]